MFKINDKVRLKKNINFSYGTVANKGDIDIIYKIDNEGYWLKNKEIYIGHGSENKYLELI